jgi:hypothetical protein
MKSLDLRSNGNNKNEIEGGYKHSIKDIWEEPPYR